MAFNEEMQTPLDKEKLERLIKQIYKLESDNHITHHHKVEDVVNDIAKKLLLEAKNDN